MGKTDSADNLFAWKKLSGAEVHRISESGHTIMESKFLIPIEEK